MGRGDRYLTGTPATTVPALPFKPDVSTCGHASATKTWHAPRRTWLCPECWASVKEKV